MRRNILAAAIIGAASCLTIAAPAHAYLMFFGQDDNGSNTVPLAAHPLATGARTSFLSSLVGVGTEDFEAHSGGAPLALTFPGAGSATLTGTGSIVSVPPGATNGFGRYATSGSKFWEATAGTTSSFSVDLSTAIAAFGFFGIDIGDFDGQLSLRLTKTDATTEDIVVPHGTGGGTTGPQNGSVLYFGLIAEGAAEEFTKVEFVNTDVVGGDTDVFAFDDLTIGSLEQVCTPNCPQVPEPGPLALLGIAAAVGLLTLRRANRQTTIG